MCVNLKHLLSLCVLETGAIRVCFPAGMTKARVAVLIGLLPLVLAGCASTQKKESSKELMKLSLDSQEEARKLKGDGNLNAAEAKYQEALRYHTSPSIHKELGDVLTELGRYEEARSQYKLALVRDPEMAEAEEALQRVEARVQLAENRPPPSGSTQPIPSTVPLERVAGGGPRGTPESPPEEPFVDEERAFDDMEKIQPPSETVQSSRRMESRPGSDKLADSLMEDTRELFGLPDTSSESVADGSFGSSLEEDLFTEESEIAASESGKEKKRLGGGRGLLRPGKKPTILMASAEMPRGGTFGQRPKGQDTVQVHPAVETRSTDKPPIPSGKPGERGFGSPRLPDVVASPRTGKETKGYGYSGPSFGPLGLDEEPAPGSGEPAGGGEQTSPSAGSEEKGFFKRILGRDSEEIVYPEAPPPGAPRGEPLPSAYPEREEIDLTGFGTSRLKGRRQPKLDLDICKKRYYEDKDLEGAVRCFGDKRIDFPDEPSLYYELGLIYRDAGSTERARQNFEMALRYDPDNEEYRQALAIADVEIARQMREEDNLHGALQILVNTKERFPEMVEVHRELAKVYIKKAMEDEASLDQGAPPTEDLLNDKAFNWGEAEKAYQEVVRLTPGNFKDWFNLGVVVQKQDNDKKASAAIAAYEKAIQLNPKYPDAHRNLAILYESRSVPKAVEHYRKALEIGRGLPEGEGLPVVTNCLRDLGVLYWKTGETEKAAEYLTEYFQYIPEDQDIAEILDQITSAPAARSE